MSAETLTGSDTAMRDLGVLARKAQTLDDASLLRFRSRTTGDSPDLAGEGSGQPLSRVWVTTPFGPFGCRTMALAPQRDSMVLRVGDVVDATAGFKTATGRASGIHTVTAGLSADSSWPGALPPESGFRQVDVIPATVFRDLETQAQSVVREDSGPLGLPGSLLDQNVLTVTEDDGSEVQVSMRQVFSLCLLGFIPEKPKSTEPVRVSTRGRWTRIDGRFGGIYASSGMGVLPL